MMKSKEMTLEQIFLHLTSEADRGTYYTEKTVSENYEPKISVDLGTGEAVVGQETEAEKEYEKEEK